MRPEGRERAVALLLAGAVVVQAVGLVVLGRLETGATLEVLAVGSGVALVVGEAWRRRLRFNHRIDMLLVMGALGGLGMLAGWLVDLDFSPPPRDAGFHAAMGHHAAGGVSGVTGSCPHAAAAAGSGSAGESVSLVGRLRGWLAMVWSAMTGLMLLAAIPPGLVLTRCAELARASRRRWVSTHVVGNLGMVVGMVVIGHAIGPEVGRLTGSNVVGGHLAMLGGMLVGMEGGMFAGEALLGLRPWQEWRWEEAASAGDGLLGRSRPS